MRIYQAILTLVASCFYVSGLVPLIRWARRRDRHVVILNYHRAAIGDLRAHLRYLVRHYRVMSLDDALEQLFDPTPDHAGERRDRHDHHDRRTPLVITFDDGYYDNYAHAARLAAEFQTPITLFLVPGYMETRQRFWWYEPDAMIRDARSREVTIDAQVYSLTRPDDQRALKQLIDARVRFASAVATREAFLTATRATLGLSAGPVGDDPDTLPFGWSEARELLANPFVTFGAHTMHHPILSSLKDPAEAHDEIVLCRTALERGLGREITAFAYPVGKGEDIDMRAVRGVREGGYRWAVTTIPGYNTRATDPHLLRRISTDPDVPVPVLAAQAAGIWHVLALSRLLRLIGISTRRRKNVPPRTKGKQHDEACAG